MPVAIAVGRVKDEVGRPGKLDVGFVAATYTEKAGRVIGFPRKLALQSADDRRGNPAVIALIDATLVNACFGRDIRLTRPGGGNRSESDSEGENEYKKRDTEHPDHHTHPARGKYDASKGKEGFGNLEMNGAPGVIRTPDLLVRSQTLYPTELRARTGGTCCKTIINIRSGFAEGVVRVDAHIVACTAVRTERVSASHRDEKHVLLWCDEAPLHVRGI